MRQTTLNDENRIDVLAKELYGTEQGGTVEALLTANFRLAANGSGFVGPGPVNTPDPPPAKPVEAVNPWE